MEIRGGDLAQSAHNASDEARCKVWITIDRSNECKNCFRQLYITRRPVFPSARRVACPQPGGAPVRLPLSLRVLSPLDPYKKCQENTTSERNTYLSPRVTAVASCSKQSSPCKCSSALPALGATDASPLPCKSVVVGWCHVGDLVSCIHTEKHSVPALQRRPPR